MFTQRRTKARDRGEQLWFILPEPDRTAARVRRELAKEGVVVSKATLSRWANEWKRIDHKAVDLVELPAEQTPATAAGLAHIRAGLRDVLPTRLLLVARGEGLDRLEDAICTLSDGLGARARRDRRQRQELAGRSGIPVRDGVRDGARRRRASGRLVRPSIILRRR